MIISLILVIAVAASSLTLYLRGFRWSQIAQRESAAIKPAYDVWLLKSPAYTDKMDAYKAGLSHSSHGCGVHVTTENGQWFWVAGVFLTADEVNVAAAQYNLPAAMTPVAYQIARQKYTMPPALATICQNLFNTLDHIWQQLLTLRTQIMQGVNQPDLAVLTADFTQLKNQVNELQKTDINNLTNLVATLIYTANQNILSLYDVIFCDQAGSSLLSIINTALLKCIFSLDNF